MLGFTTLFKKLASRRTSQVPESRAKGGGDEQVQLRKRRLIKGAAATAPMILTLYNGAAFARSSIVVTEAIEYDELFDAEKGIGNPICVTAERLESTGDPRNYHVYNGFADLMECKNKNTNADGSCRHPSPDAVNRRGINKREAHFKYYNKNCEEQGTTSVLIVASSSASLIH